MTSERKESRKEKFDRLLKAALPDIDPKIIDEGRWSDLPTAEHTNENDEDENGIDLKDSEFVTSAASSPYKFSNLRDGRQRLSITHPITGDVVNAVGIDRDDLLNNLEKKLESR